MTSAFESRGPRPARVSHHGVAADRLRSTRREARTWRMIVVGQRVARSIPTPSAEARPHRHRDRLAAWAFTGHFQRNRIPWRATPAPIASWSNGWRTAENALRSADLAWLCCEPSRDALHPHAVGRGATAPSARPIDARGFERSWPARLSRVARVPRAYLSHHGVAAYRPRSMRREARTWRT